MQRTWKAQVILTLLLVGVSSTPASGGGLPKHKAELLLAQLEDLQNRLHARSGPTELDLPGVTVQSDRAQEEARRLAGGVLVRTPVTLQGQSAAVLRWLDAARRRRIAGLAPLEIRAVQGPGRRVRLSIAMWRLSEPAKQLTAPQGDLLKLRDNLLWLEQRLTAMPDLLSLLDVLSDTEVVSLDKAVLSAGEMQVLARALDKNSAAAFRATVSERADKLSHPPKLLLRLRSGSPAENQQPSDGLLMRDLGALDALFLAANLAEREIVVAAGELPRLNGNVRPADAQDLLETLVRKVNLERRRFGSVLVLGSKLAAKPPSAAPFGERPIELVAHRSSATTLWNRVAAGARIGVLAPKSKDLHLTVALQRRTSTQVASLIAWVLGLEVHGDDHLSVLLPAGSPEPKPISGPATVWAQAAPLEELAAGLAGLDSVSPCGVDAGPVDLRASAVDPSAVLESLLATRGLELNRAEGSAAARLVTRGQPAERSCLEGSPPAAGPESRFTAAILEKGGSRALVADAGSWRWVRAGDRLADGSQVLKIRSDHLVLKDARGFPADLGTRPRAQTVPAGQAGPTRRALADLRLAATSHIRDHAPMAVLEDGRGGVFLVSPGDALGRRCGRAESVLPGRLVVSLGCARDHEPKRVELFLSGVSP